MINRHNEIIELSEEQLMNISGGRLIRAGRSSRRSGSSSSSSCSGALSTARAQRYIRTITGQRVLAPCKKY